LDRVAESMTRNKKTRIAGFRKERVPFSSWKRYTGQRSWKSIASWTVILVSEFNFLNLDTLRYFASGDRNRKYEPKGRRWNPKEKVLAVFIIKCSPRSYVFFRFLFHLTSRRTLHFLLNTV
jgi:hypothetical protein